MADRKLRQVECAPDARARRARRNGADPFGFDPAMRERVKPLFRFLYKYYWRVEVEGIENVPAEGPVLLAANHSGTLPFDAAMISLAVEENHPSHRIVRMLYAKFVRELPAVGTFYQRLGGVEASTANGLTLLKRGEAVGIFPEGEQALGKPYHQAYCLRPFRTGVAHLSTRIQAPVVPVAVIGAEETTRALFRIPQLPEFLKVPFLPIPSLFPCGPLGLIPLPTKWRIRFGTPVYPAERYRRRAREHVMHECAEYVRAQVQRLLDAERLRRTTVIFG
jgi:1-acyl-sn-glycerol-3-phosphate acyltransferase